MPTLDPGEGCERTFTRHYKAGWGAIAFLDHREQPPLIHIQEHKQDVFGDEKKVQALVHWIRTRALPWLEDELRNRVLDELAPIQGIGFQDGPYSFNARHISEDEPEKLCLMAWEKFEHPQRVHQTGPYSSWPFAPYRNVEEILGKFVDLVEKRPSDMYDERGLPTEELREVLAQAKKALGITE